MIGAGGRVASFEIESRVSSEAHPGKEEDGTGDQPEGSPAIAGLLFEEIRGSHCNGGMMNGGMRE